MVYSCSKNNLMLLDGTHSELHGFSNSKKYSLGVLQSLAYLGKQNQTNRFLNILESTIDGGSIQYRTIDEKTGLQNHRPTGQRSKAYSGISDSLFEPNQFKIAKKLNNIKVTWKLKKLPNNCSIKL
ncbi:hypothetical protein BB561_003585 [Smittium simulii]|uniref:Uncharacterized protein n=1 Tax=Smittium simulii TaxID=133385 RepID=A0A2T9YKP8_9FUNG|nr:hypothetical protein BB561_003585 [Smittium simulii]